MGSTIVRAVFGFFHLFPDRFEKSANPDLAHAIGDEGRNETAGVRVNGISGASFICAIWLQQPPAIANIYSHDPGLFRRAKLVRGFPPI